MKLKEYRDDYYNFSGTVSKINRQLALAGVGIIWIFFQTGFYESDTDIQKLLFCLKFLVLALLVDFVQYIYQTVAWYIFYKKKEKQGIGLDTEIEKNPEKLNIPTWIFYCIKIIMMGIGYVGIFSSFSKVIFK